MGGIARAASGLISKGVKSLVDKALPVVAKKASELLGKVSDKLPGLIEKVKGKLPSFVQKFAGKFLDKAQNWLQNGPLKSLKGVLDNVKSGDDLATVWKNIKEALKGGFRAQPVEVQQNATELAAQSPARILREQMTQQLVV